MKFFSTQKDIQGSKTASTGQQQLTINNNNSNNNDNNNNNIRKSKHQLEKTELIKKVLYMSS